MGTVESKPEENVNKEEESKDCGFCVFMKSGPCRYPYMAWDECVEEAEAKKENVVAKCSEVTKTLNECVTSHPEYYQKIFMAVDKASQDEDDGKAKAEAEKKVTGKGVKVEKEVTGKGVKESHAERFVKSGPCRYPFRALEHCVSDAESNKEDAAEKCQEVKSSLDKCVNSHPEYYKLVMGGDRIVESAVDEKLAKKAEMEKEVVEAMESNAA
ncbi:hypothetical protein Tsubulata_034369 [Turnera subulata]|uniref:GCK domain-containing protein n=1 Tax=Turnera subulata TaxID=218843 RepID=A0A9Q0FRR5_9ROSI|nr:hypothetical protein Tsubulata_034369 [Turnera subulata]